MSGAVCRDRVGFLTTPTSRDPADESAAGTQFLQSICAAATLNVLPCGTVNSWQQQSLLASHWQSHNPRLLSKRWPN